MKKKRKPTEVTQTLVKAGCSYLCKLSPQKITAKVTTNVVGRPTPHITSVEQNRRAGVGAEANGHNPEHSAAVSTLPPGLDILGDNQF